MKNKINSAGRILCILLFVILIAGVSGTYAWAKGSTITVSGLQKTIDGVLAYQQKQAEVTGVQNLIDTSLTDSAGANSSDWFIIALTRYQTKYNYESYLKALEAYTDGMKNAKATDYQRIALVYSAVNHNADDIKSIINDSTGQLGIMSYIYGLILLDSRAYSDKEYSREDIIEQILKLQLSDGGWALNGKVSDIDVTAMALQSLAPYTQDEKVVAAVNKALTLLSKRQQDTGDYSSWGTRCCESTAQVITALAALDIDILKDQRFIKKNKSLIDGLFLYQHKDGSFGHTIDGRSDHTAGVQAMYSLIAVWRQWKGLSSFYDFADTGWTVAPAVAGNSDQTAIGQTVKGEASTEQSAGSQTEAGQSSDVQSAVDQTSAGRTGTNQSTDQSTAEQTVKGQIAENQRDIGQTDNYTGQTDNNVDQPDNDNIDSFTKEQSQIEDSTASGDEAKVTQPASLNSKAGTTDQSLSEPFKTKRNSPMNYRMIVTMVVLAVAALTLGIRYTVKKQSRKLTVIVLAVAGILIFAVWGLKLQTVEDYYRTNPGNTSSDAGTVLISIRCDTVAGKNKDIPVDGTILDKATLPVTDGDSVLDELIKAAKQNKIPLDYTGGDSTALSSSYVNGINNLYENDFGNQSGWLYRVNGAFPGTACGEYKVKAGDEIEWVYTCDLGKDVGRQ